MKIQKERKNDVKEFKKQVPNMKHVRANSTDKNLEKYLHENQQLKQRVGSLMDRLKRQEFTSINDDLIVTDYHENALSQKRFSHQVSASSLTRPKSHSYSQKEVKPDA